MRDITEVIKCQTRLYADDTCIFVGYEDPDEAAVALESDLESILDWANSWFVKFNAQKTIDLTCSRKHFVYSPSLTMDETVVPKATSHKHLGITIQNDAKWHENTANMVSKAKRRVDILRSFTHKLDRAILEKLYIVYIRPLMEYAGEVWDNCTQKEKDELEGVQREAARVVLGVKRGTSHSFIYRETGWEALQERRSREKIIQMYKIRKGLTSQTLRDIIPETQSARGPNARQPWNLQVPPHNTQCLHKSFVNDTITLWNNLPANLKAIETLDSFKRTLKQQSKKEKPSKRFLVGSRKPQILHARIRSENCDLNANLNAKNLVESPNCQCGEPETTAHYLLHCQTYAVPRAVLQLEINGLGIARLNVKDLLFGKNELNEDTNIKIIKSTQKYIMATQRFKK